MHLSRNGHSLAPRPHPIKMLTLSSLVLMAILLSSPAAYASHWKVSVTDSGGSQTTAVITGIPGFDPGQNVTTPWTPPADGNNSTSFNLGSDVLLTAGDASGSCSATVNAKVTLTWVADPASDPAPTQVWIVETAAASAYAIGTGPTSQASDGLPGDSYVKDPPGYHLDGGSMVTPSGLPGGGRLTKLTVSNGSVSFNHALSASSSSGESQSDAVDDQDNAYLSYTLTVHATPYNFKKVVGGGNIGFDGTLSFTYDWLSTDGNRNDLTTCYWREYVTYPGPVGTAANPNQFYPQNPPFNFVPGVSWLNNPYVNPPPPSLGNLMTGPTATDTQNVPPLVDPSLYTYGTFTATQVFQYTDTATGDSNIQIPGPDSGPFSIVREFKSYDPNNYRYTVTKDGKMSFVLKPF